MNYAFGRHGFDVPAGLKGHPMTVELFPAFARESGARPWRARVRVRFLLRQPTTASEGTPITVVAGGRAAVPLGRTPLVAVPQGFAPLVELRIHDATGQGLDAIRRVAAQP